MSRKHRKSGGDALTVTIAVVLVVFVFALSAFVVCTTTFVHDDGTWNPRSLCINNLRIIDGAKGQWALEHNKQNTDTPVASEIQPYVGHGRADELPVCPSDPKHSFATSYSLNNVRTVPTCKILPTNHILR
jgi:hypothetical protein